MQNFSLPQAIFQDLDRISMNFFWNKYQDNKSGNLISWDKIGKPKRHGGLGNRKAHVNNMAFQMKLIWRIFFYSSNLWVSLIKKKYIKVLYL